jgi:hypothetical protein
MHLKINGGDLSQLKHTATRLEEEAATWREGFAVYVGDRLHWDKHGQWAEVRYTKLLASAAYIRRLIARIGPSEPEYYI